MRTTVSRLALAIALCFVVVPSTRLTDARSQEPGPPNVLIIVTDDQRATQTLRIMPEVRRWFGRRGTRFTNAFATTPTCCPSRASIFSGRYAHNHGVRTSEPGQAENLDPGTALQAHLVEAGYRTAIYGKYLNSWPRAVDPPDFSSWAIYSGKVRRSYHGGNWNVEGRMRKVGRYSTSFIERRALRFVEATETYDDDPWLMYVTPYAPHKPSTPQGRDADASVPRFRENPAILEEDRSDKPESVADKRAPAKKLRDVHDAQLRSLLAVDRMVGRLMRSLRDAGELDNTMALFLSDNGYLWGEHGLLGKREPYRASVQIPFLVRWPGVFDEGSADDRLVATIDIAPTAFDAAGITIPSTVDGRSLLADGERDRLLLEHWRRANRTTPDWAGMWTKEFEYIEHYLRDRLIVTDREYYDLAEDPWQLENLFGDGDPTNDPEITDTSLQLQRDIRCAGRGGSFACP